MSVRHVDRFVGAGSGWSLARQLFVLQVLVVLAVVLAGVGLAWYEAGRQTRESAQREVVAVARTLAEGGEVRAAVRTDDPTATLQPLAESVRAATGVGFITIMDPSGTRFTHPNPDRIGQRFLGHTRTALEGRVFTETYTGTLGPSVRAVAPVFGEGRTVRALVAVGIPVRVLTAELREQVVGLIAVAAGALGLAAAATYLVGHRVRRHTYGLRPAELARMYEYHDAILHAVREGLLLLDPDGRVRLCNDGAAELLATEPAAIEGVHVSEIGLPRSLADVLASGRAVHDEVHLTDDRVLLLNVSAVRSGGRELGNVVTLRDHTQLEVLSGELNSMRGFSESLRSQAHESANRLHAVVSLIELGRTDEAVEFATAELDLAQRLTDRVVGAVDEPVLAAVLLGKSAEASERGVEVVLSDDTVVDDTALSHIPTRDLVTVLSNLIDNAVEAGAARVEVTARVDDDGLFIRVADDGPGLPAEALRAAFERGWSTKEDGRGIGLALVARSVRRNGGAIELETGAGAVFTVRIPSKVDT